MAYNATNEERTELFSIEKNSRGEFIKGAKIVNKNTNNENIDIRQFYTNDDGNVNPTSKGVRFNSEHLMDFMKGMIKALDVAELTELTDAINAEIEGRDS